MYLSNVPNLRRRSELLLLLTSMLVIQTGCVRTPYVPNSNSNGSVTKGETLNSKISIAVEVISFKSQAIHDDSADGVSVSYDLSLLKIVAPGAHFGARLQVIHPSGTAQDPIWTSVGRRCVVKIDPWILDESDVLVPAKDLKMTCES